DTLKRHLHHYPNAHAGIVIEPILGEGGFYPGSSSFFREVLSQAREAGLLVFLDEVQSFGRTSQPFAFQHFDLNDLVDVVTVGKMTQLCATLYRAEWNPEPALLSQTFTASTSAIYAAKAILQELQTGGYFGPDGKNLRLGASFTSGLHELSQRLPGSLTGPFGLGGMVGFTPLDGSPAKTMKLVHALYEEGLMGFPAGKSPSRIRFLLPMGVLEPSHLDVALSILETVLSQFLPTSP
ncbi:MAG: aminotransferase class III-fold pyridoxal phosphate-dependent enzyme, partial [Verrucomicrobiota bacterium]